MRRPERVPCAYTIARMRPVPYRIGLVAATVAALAAAAWLGGPPDPTEQAAKRLQAERWYGVNLHGTDIGHFRTLGRMARAGFLFESELVFRLGTGPRTRIVETFVFDGQASHRLVSAEHDYVSADNSTRVSIERRHGGGLAASVNGQITELDWDYRLQDYLAVETWLARDRAVGAALDSQSIDFDRLSLKRESWRVVGRNDTGYRLRNRGASIMQLDANHLPVRLHIANLFEMNLAGASWTAQAWRGDAPASDARMYDVGIDKPLDSPRDLARLLLRVRSGDAIDTTSWPMLRRDAGGDLLLESQRNARRRAGPDEIKALSVPTTLHPAADPAIKRLAQRAASGLTEPIRQVEALVHFVHGYIDYAEEDSARTVLNVLRDRRGDCTEYANLLTTMARALGYAARTVTGLAYDVEAQAFALHNWSEVAVEGWWHPVDPTWGQVTVDAGHLRLPDKPGLAVFGLLPGIEFELLEAEYERSRT